jgi:hypothetical protein
MAKQGSIPSISNSSIEKTSNTNRGRSGVEFWHPEYEAKQGRWRMLDSVLAGEQAIKAGKEVYLPKNNEADNSAEAQNRYDNFLKRAVFYNVTRRTVNTLLGAVFKKEPTLTVPPSLDYVADDIDGMGVNIYQQSRNVYQDVLAKGRYGLLVDYPETDGAVSVQDQIDGVARATVVPYEPTQIINWRTSKIGAKHVLSLVVLQV